MDACHESREGSCRLTKVRASEGVRSEIGDWLGAVQELERGTGVARTIGEWN